MDLLQLAALAFLAGLVSCGIATSLCELLAKEQVRFAEPFVSGAHLKRSALVLVIAGPFMLVNDALAARARGGVSNGTVAFCGAAAIFWLVATGFVQVAFASRVVELLA